MNSDAYKQLSLKEFDRAAEQFDDNSPSVYNMCRKDYPDILEEIQKEEFQDMLDAGCGTGAMIHMLYKDIPDKHYTGLDFSEKMIAAAARKKMEGVRFVQGDCEAMPFEAESFDVITCSMSFHHYPAPGDFFKSVSRVLRGGGRLILRDMASRKKWLMYLVNHVEIPLINKIAKKGDVHVYSREEIQKLCDMSGLRLERYEVRKGFRLHCVCRKL